MVGIKEHVAIDPIENWFWTRNCFAILLRVGVQRTYSMKGCLQNSRRSCWYKMLCDIRIYRYFFEVKIGLWITGGFGNCNLSNCIYYHWLHLVCSLVPYSNWLVQRFCSIHERVYMVLFYVHLMSILGLIICAEYLSYQLADFRYLFVLRVEKLWTINEESGHIVLDKPKMIKLLENGRYY
jgi:hypothetical protein